MKKIVYLSFTVVFVVGVWAFFLFRAQDPATVFPAQTITPVPSVESTPVPAAKDTNYDVPFIVQAPRHNWKDPVYQNACEEASLLMAARWVEGLTLSNDEAFSEIQKISDFSQKNYGYYVDQSAEDTARLFRDYFQNGDAEYVEDISTDNIKIALNEGNLVIVPANGRKLGNPFFTQPGPERHMLVIKGYDLTKKEFITNDPGIGKGNGYRYKEQVLFDAIRDYPSGDHKPIETTKKSMIVVKK